MAHEINIENGKAAMAYSGLKPWHGLGQELTESADIETWKHEAGMEWHVEETGLEYNADKPMLLYRTFPGKKVLYRSDSKAALSVVGSGYKAVHPPQLIDFFGTLVKDCGFRMKTAGVLFNGVVYWALAQVGEGFELKGGDKIEPYLLASTSCDGSMSTVLHYTSVQVVCKNTLNMAIGRNGANAKMKISHKTLFDFEDAYEKLGIIDRTRNVTGDFEENVRVLSGIKISDNLAIEILARNFKKIGKKHVDMTDSEIVESSSAIKRIMALYKGDAITANLESSKGTAWGLIGAMTQYSDFEAGIVNGDKSRSFFRNHFSDRAEFKRKVVDDFLQYV